jgi:hypothetical protein
MNPTLDPLNMFLTDAERDASARAGDPFDRTPLLTAFAEAELDVIGKLRTLVATSEDVRAFVARWRERVETASPDEYPQRRGAVFGKTDEATWTVGAQRLRAAVTLFDAIVLDDVVKGYRTLGTITED